MSTDKAIPTRPLIPGATVIRDRDGADVTLLDNTIKLNTLGDNSSILITSPIQLQYPSNNFVTLNPPSNTNSIIVKYNIRAALTVGALTGGPSSGTSVSAFSLKTATLSVTGTISQVNSGRIFTVGHGGASGVKSFYFTTSSRIYRCPVANITAASTSYLSETMLEVPPGGSVTYTSPIGMGQVDYSSTIDRLFITTTGGRFGTYVGQYKTDGSQFEKYVGSNLSRLKFTTTPDGASDGLFPQAALTLWTEDGWMFTIPSTTTSGQNWLYVFPFGAVITLSP